MEGKLLESIAVRLDEALMGRLESYALRIEELAGVRIARGVIARKLITIALDAVEDRPLPAIQVAPTARARWAAKQRINDLRQMTIELVEESSRAPIDRSLKAK